MHTPTGDRLTAIKRADAASRAEATERRLRRVFPTNALGKG
jgi:hypothetical protein